MQWTASQRGHLDYAGICTGMYTTTSDLLKLLGFLNIGSLEVDDYLMNDGFSYGINKDQDCTIIVLSNAKHPVCGEISTGIKSILKKEEYILPLARKEVEVDLAILQQYVGNIK